ncbi:MAG: hypothetical protein AABY13_02165, partial [Nanoarchaeota archaeon]
WHAYRVTNERKHLYFATAFGLISLSFLGRLFAAATIALNAFSEAVVEPASSALGVGWQIFSLGRLAYVWLVLAAYGILLGLALKWQRKRDVLVLLALTTVITATSVIDSWPFYLASLALVFCIALQHYFNYRQRKAATAYNIFVAFGLLTLEPFLFLLASAEPALIAAAYGVRLIAYLIVLKTLWKVLSNE